MRPEHWLYTIPLRLRSLFRWAHADQELDDELRDHLERKTEEYMAQGMTQAEAHRRARGTGGGLDPHRAWTARRERDARIDRRGGGRRLGVCWRAVLGGKWAGEFAEIE